MCMCMCVCVQGDNEWKGNYGYISYFLVLLFWEVLPTSLIVIFFRVKLPCSCPCKRSVSVHGGRTHVHVLETEVLMYVHGVQSIGNTLVARVYVHIT